MSEKVQYPVRAEVEIIESFKNTCAKFGRYHYDVARELLQAYAENRVAISLTPKQKEEREVVYHESGE